MIACVPTAADLTPHQLEAKRSLVETAQTEEYVGSIFTQAKVDGIDYRPILKRAINLDKEALVSLFPMKFAGEGGETHCSNLKALMVLWGDAQFAEVLGSQSVGVRDLVVRAIKHSWADPDWASYPKTIATASPEQQSTTKEPNKSEMEMPRKPSD